MSLTEGEVNPGDDRMTRVSQTTEQQKNESTVGHDKGFTDSTDKNQVQHSCK